MKRPFQIKLSQHCPPRVLELQLFFESNLTPQEKFGWSDVLKTFMNCGSCGALAGSKIAPLSSGCILDQEEFLEREARWRFDHVALDDNACSVLLNLCHWGHFNVSRVRQLVLRWERCSEEVAGGGDFPLVWPHLSFALQEYELVGQTIAIDIEFIDRLSSTHRDVVNDSIRQWFKAANWGGYADESFLVETSTILISSPPIITDELSISWYLDSYLCSYRAFDGLLNCLERISAAQAPIRNVIIGE